jgi:myosin heavy subunit
LPKEIPESVVGWIVRLWIMGFAPEQIADKTGVSQGTVRNKIADLKAGRFQEYAGYVEQLDDMRWVARQTRGKGRGLQGALIGLTILEGIKELGIEPSELMGALQFFRKLKQAGILPERFLESAKHLMDLEESTGLRYEKLVEEFQRLTEKVEALRSEEKRRNAAIAKLRQAEEQELQGLHATRQDLASYKNDKEALESVSLTIKDLNSTAEFIRGTRDQSLLNAAAELARLKSRTGKSYEQLMDEYTRKSTDLERLKTQTEELEQKQQTLKEQCTKAETQLESELKQAKVTREQLVRHVETRQQLANCGLQIEEIQNLPMVVRNLKAAGYDHRKIIACLGQIESLQTQTEEGKSTLKCLQFQINTEKLELGRTRQQMATGKKQLRRLEESIETGLSTLKELDQKKVDLEEMIFFGDTFTKLMLDPSKLVHLQIEMLISTLGSIKAARAHPMRLPVDYEGLRQEMQTLVEALLGKQLILRESHLRELQSLRDKNLELQSDRLGKLANIRQEKLDLEAARKAFETMTRQQLTHAALNEIAEGNVTILQCQRCNAVLAYHADTKFWSSFCPFCSIGNLETVRPPNR